MFWSVPVFPEDEDCSGVDLFRDEVVSGCSLEKTVTDDSFSKYNYTINEKLRFKEESVKVEKPVGDTGSTSITVLLAAAFGFLLSRPITARR